MLGSGIGITLGSINWTTGTTAAVVTGMGMILLFGWLGKVLVQWIQKSPSKDWARLTVGIGFMVGAINLTVAMVLLPLAIWRVVWPFQVVPWPTVGAVIGAIAAVIGGIITSIFTGQQSSH